MLEFVVGDKKDINNPFRWDRVILNLPGHQDYNPKNGMKFFNPLPAM